MLELVRKNARFFAIAGLAALGLRLLFVFAFPAVVDDSRLYADIAKNWLNSGIYGITDSGQITPTLSRLPGYPAFLAVIFGIFGIDNFRAVLLIQVLFDLGTCFLIASMARRMFSPRAAKAAFLLSGLCPFLANYAAAALTETLEIFFTALALDMALRGLGVDGEDAPELHLRTPPWLGCGLAVGAAILLRPDGGILLAAIGGYLLILLAQALRSSGAASSPHSERQEPALSRSKGWGFPILQAGVLFGVSALVPLIPWTLRNLHTLHRFEPLAPRYANDSDELPMPGFNRWTKTWIAEYTSVQEIYWNVPGSGIDARHLPNRAFDSPQQRQETVKLLEDYNQEHEVTPELDARFAQLAASRIHNAPLRYYFWLPTLRIADMWLRPRTELLPSDPRWWEFNDDPRWLAVSLVFGALGLLYAVLAAAGLIRARGIFAAGLFILFLLLRSGFLGTLENPEPRYTLECYPAAILLASALWTRRSKGIKSHL